MIKKYIQRIVYQAEISFRDTITRAEKNTMRTARVILFIPEQTEENPIRAITTM